MATRRISRVCIGSGGISGCYRLPLRPRIDDEALLEWRHCNYLLGTSNPFPVLGSDLHGCMYLNRRPEAPIPLEAGTLAGNYSIYYLGLPALALLRFNCAIGRSQFDVFLVGFLFTLISELKSYWNRLWVVF